MNFMNFMKFDSLHKMFIFSWLILLVLRARIIKFIVTFNDDYMLVYERRTFKLYLYRGEKKFLMWFKIYFK